MATLCNNKSSIHTQLMSTASSIKGLLIIFFNRRTTSATEGCTTGNETNYIWYKNTVAPAYFTSDVKLFFGLTLLRPMNRIRWTGFVASTIIQSHTCQLLPVMIPEWHSILDKSTCRLWHLIQADVTTMQNMPRIF
jgi:hypothetical protein